MFSIAELESKETIKIYSWEVKGKNEYKKIIEFDTIMVIHKALNGRWPNR